MHWPSLSARQQHGGCARRWRKLEGSDPSSYEMVMKCQALQKRVIAAAEACVEKDAQIQEQEKLHQELKAILARQPGPEAAFKISELEVLLARLHTLSVHRVSVLVFLWRQLHVAPAI